MYFQEVVHTTSSFLDMILSRTPDSYIKETKYTAIFEW